MPAGNVDGCTVGPSWLVRGLPKPRGAVRSAALALVVAAATAAVVAGSFLSLYAGRTDGVPAGRDTSFYVWRAKLVAAEGLAALPDSIVRPFRAQAYRAGHPVLAGFLDTVTGIDPFEWAFALPGVMAAVAALGAGAFALQGAREPRWAFPVYAVAVGTSLNLTQISIGRADNLMVDALVLAGAAVALMAAAGDRTIWAGVLLLVAAIATHWSLALVFVAVLAALAVVLLPRSVREARTTGIAATPSGRLGLLLAGTALAGAATLAAAPAGPELPNDEWVGRVGNKLHRQGAGFALTAAAAVPGTAALLVPPDPRRRRGLLLAALWAGVAAAGLIALLPSDLHVVPAHRNGPGPRPTLAAGLALAGWVPAAARALRANRGPTEPVGAAPGDA